MSRQHQNLRELIFLNIGILLISTSGVLGRYITMPSVAIIFFRSAIGLLALLLFARIMNTGVSINWAKDRVIIIVSALLMGGHWLTYFYSLEYSNIALALLSLYSHPAMTAFLEPLILKTRPNIPQMIMGGIIIFGIYVMVPLDGSLSQSHLIGVGLGLLSALCYSLRNITMRDLSQGYDGIFLMITQVGIVSILLLPALFFVSIQASPGQWLAIISLGVVTSAIGHCLYIRGLHSFTASTAGILSSSIPVYGILWGCLFLSETPSFRTMLGGLIIIGVVLAGSLYERVRTTN